MSRNIIQIMGVVNADCVMLNRGPVFYLSNACGWMEWCNKSRHTIHHKTIHRLYTNSIIFSRSGVPLRLWTKHEMASLQPTARKFFGQSLHVKAGNHLNYMVIDLFNHKWMVQIIYFNIAEANIRGEVSHPDHTCDVLSACCICTPSRGSTSRGCSAARPPSFLALGVRLRPSLVGVSSFQL